MEQYKSKNLILILCLAVTILIGISYAFFSAFIYGNESTSTVALNAGRMEIVFEDGDPAIVVNGIYPRRKAWAEKDFTITGTNTTKGLIANYDIYLVPDDITFVNEGFRYDLISDGEGAVEECLGCYINSGYLGEGQFMPDSTTTHNYTFKLYYNDTGYDQSEDQGATVAFHIELVSGGTIDTNHLLYYRILADNEVKEPLTEPGKETSLYTFDDSFTFDGYVDRSEEDYYLTYGTGYEQNQDGTFNLTGVTTGKWNDIYEKLHNKYIASPNVAQNSSPSNIQMPTSNLDIIYKIDYIEENYNIYFTYQSQNSLETEALLASTSDNYGTSYYFRGMVKNNYVEYRNMCWKIVGMTGDKKVKLVLYNSSKTYRPCAKYSTFDGPTIGTSAFNLDSNTNNYVGFAMGINSDIYEITHMPVYNSNISYYLENWYDNEIFGPIYGKFCNDKSLYSGPGYGSEHTIYAGNNRLYAGGNYKTMANPTLSCIKPDTVPAILSQVYGEDINISEIDSTIGLLTADEIAFAGGVYGEANTGYYLAENSYTPWWTMTPSKFDSKAEVFTVNNGGLYSTPVDEELGIRPVVYVKMNQYIRSGDGSLNSPYLLDSGE